MRYATEYDWVMVGVKEVDLELKPLGKMGLLDRDYLSSSGKNEQTLIKATNTWMMFGPIWNKVYRTDIVKKNNLMFVTTTNVNDDRIFNMNYACHVRSVALSEYMGYNYVVNPNSITHRRIKPSIFLNTGLEMDRILLQTGLLGAKMQRYTANFACRFITRAMIEGLLHPEDNRWREFGATIRTFLKSKTFGKYGTKTFWWSIAYVVDGIKRKK